MFSTRDHVGRGAHFVREVRSSEREKGISEGPFCQCVSGIHVRCGSLRVRDLCEMWGFVFDLILIPRPQFEKIVAIREVGLSGNEGV